MYRLDLDDVKHAGLAVYGSRDQDLLLCIFLGVFLIVQVVPLIRLRIDHQGILAVFELDDLSEIRSGILLALLLLRRGYGIRGPKSWRKWDQAHDRNKRHDP